MAAIQLVIPGEPQGKGRPRLGKGFTFTPKKTVEYENWIKMCFVQSKQEKLNGQIEAIIKAYYGIPNSMTKKDREKVKNGVLRPTKKPDLDNICKAVLDSLNELAYKDDSQIVHLIMWKEYSNEPRVEIELREREVEG